MVGLVLVSHSRKLAEGVAELARHMAGSEVRIAVAGGLEGAEGGLGTDAARVAQAMESVYSEAGVLVLVDLGSAALNAELALELLPPGHRERVLLCDAPLVEGAVAAAAQARLGASLERVAAEARAALGAKQGQLEVMPTAPPPEEEGGEEATLTLRLRVPNRQGLHARPAVRVVQAAGRFKADVYLRNLTTGSEPVAARSLHGVMALGVRQGHEIEFIASGEGAERALSALRALAETHFGDVPELAAPVVAGAAQGEELAGAWLRGFTASPGRALGPALVLREHAEEDLQAPAGTPEQEWERLLQALEATRRDLAAMRAALRPHSDSSTAEIFDAHLLLLEDAELLRLAQEGIYLGLLSAAVAWRAAVEMSALRHESLEDEYLRSRSADVRDVGRQVLQALQGSARSAVAVPHSGILVAREFAPSDVARLAGRNVHGLCAARGSATSHAAILARSLGLPAVFGLGEAILQVEEGTLLLVDGTAARVCLEPDEGMVAEHRERVGSEQQARRVAWEKRDWPAMTRDGQRVEVVANIASVEDAQAATEAGADGVGLLRTEFLFLQRASAPDMEEQYKTYVEAARALRGRPLLIRTLDVGGDKPLPYLPVGEETNPFLGVRGLRFSLRYRELFVTQLRAIAWAAAEHPIHVMFPMVTTLEEWREARGLWEETVAMFEGARRAEVGLMVEVPAAALLAPHLAEEAHFFSLGTNDLTQYLFAAERGNAQVAHLADPLNPALLQVVARVAEAAHAKGRWVGVCGELASDLQAVPLLLGLGVEELSVNVPAVALVKEAVRVCHEGEARALAQRALACGSAAEVRELLAG